MDKQKNELSEDKLNAGRGVAKQPRRKDNNNTVDKENKDDRPDERARKAGF